jgi:hypothetical protein
LKQLSPELYQVTTLPFKSGRLNVHSLHQYVYHITANNSGYSVVDNALQSHSKNLSGIIAQEKILISQITKNDSSVALSGVEYNVSGSLVSSASYSACDRWIMFS